MTDEEKLVVDSLRKLAEWFDNPAMSRPMSVELVAQKSYSPGFLLRKIVKAVEE